MNYSYDSFPDKLYAKDLLALGLGDFLKLGPIFHRVRALLRTVWKNGLVEEHPL